VSIVAGHGRQILLRLFESLSCMNPVDAFGRIAALFHEPIMLIDSDGRVWAANESACQLLLGKPISTLAPLEWTRTPDKVLQYLRACSARDAPLRAEIEFTDHVSGNVVARSCLGTWFASDNGATLILLRVSSGVTSDAELARLRGQQRSVDSKDQFLSTLSHELRNPLAALTAASHLLSKSAQKPEVIAMARDALHRQVAIMSDLLDVVQDATRLSQGRIQLACEPTDVMAPVLAAVQAVRSALDAKQHRLNVEAPVPSPTMLIDGKRITQMLVQLLTNAIRYTDRGGQIHLDIDVGPAEIVMCVRDNGVGIAAERLDSLFDQASSKERAPRASGAGLGLGLALVKGLVDVHHGSVVARSDGPGTGSEFIVRLPVTERV
jgi:signal transduction histidine kinase